MRPQIVVVGASAGGLRAIERILGQLPESFSVPIIIVQHRGRDSKSVSVLMAKVAHLPLREAEDKDDIKPGVFMAPPDYHLLVEPGRLALSTDDPVSFSRPSIDVLFESAADAYGAGVLAVLLTGANTDGTHGLARIRAAGGYAIVQDPRTAERPEMPSSAIASGAADCVVPLDEIGDELVQRSMHG